MTDTTQPRANRPGFSVIVPTYRRLLPLRDCLKALAAQDYPRDRFEIIVVDDGNIDAVEPNIRDLTQRMNCRVLRQPNRGPAAARNAAAAIAAHQWLAFTDDDCLPRPEWLRHLEEALGRSPDALVGGLTINQLVRNVYAQASQDLIDYLYAYFNADPLNARFLTSNNIAASRGTFFEVGGFNAALTGAGGEDRELGDHWRAMGFPLQYIDGAIVDHQHEMDLGGFLRQQFGYGRAAPMYHQVRALRGQKAHNGRTPEPLSFYTRMFRSSLREGSGGVARRCQRLSLMLLTQLAYTAGVVVEIAWFRRQLGSIHHANSQKPGIS